MKQFIRLMLSEEGLPSSKRVLLFVFSIAFLVEIFVDIFIGKHPIDELRQELFWALSGALGTVFGSNILNKVAEIKKTQSDNNSKVGAPSPTPQPDTVVMSK